MLFQYTVAPTDGSRSSQDAVNKRMESKKLIVGGVPFLYMIDLALEQVKKAGLAALCRPSQGRLVQGVLEQAVNHDLNVVGAHETHTDPVKT